MRKKNILLISPVRNESGFIRRTIRSVLAQSVRPARWIIVDDGSSDDTASIVEEYAKEHDWIRLAKKPDRGIRAVGPGVVESFYYGLSGNDLDEFEYVCKLDGDLEFKEQYFENLIEKFQEDPQLGSASGKPFILVNNKLVPERTNDEMVAGQINFYRVECFRQIGGFVAQVHWDAIAFHRARMEGWRTQSFRDAGLQFIHLRLMGSSDKGIVNGRMRWGKGQYFIGTHPLYLLGIGIYRSFEKPFLIGGACIIIGYLKAFLERDKQYNYPGFRQSLHAWQMEKLKLGQRKEQINLINTNILSISLEELLKQLKFGVLVTPNVDHIMQLQKNREFYLAYQSANWIICDSKILQLASSFLRQPFKEVIPGSCLLPAYYNYHRHDEDVKIFLLGARPGVASSAMDNINRKVGRKMVVGAYSPSLNFDNDSEENEAIVEQINASRATVLVVGLGAPKQETWIMNHKKQLKTVNLFMALGATIDFEAGYRKRAPVMFRKLCLEWLYRLIQEPTRLWKRYLVDDLPFFWYLILQKLGLYKNPFETRQPSLLKYYPKPNL